MTEVPTRSAPKRADMTITEKATTEETRVDQHGETGYADAAYPRQARRRRRRALPLLATFLLVIAAILVIGDRVAAKLAADQIETRVVAELSDRGIAAESTRVDVAGFPFLTQVADGRYDKITVDMDNVRLRGANLPRLNVVARNVTADTAALIDGTAKVVADRVSGTGTVDYASLATIVDYGRFGLTGVSFAPSGNGGVSVRGTAKLVGGLEVPLAMTADLSAADGDVRVRVRDVELDNAQVPAGVRRAVDNLVRKLSVDVPLPDLPFSLSLDRVRAEDQGLQISATARGVSLVS